MTHSQGQDDALPRDTCQRDTSQPDTAQPDTPQPDIAQPEAACQPGVTALPGDRALRAGTAAAHARLDTRLASLDLASSEDYAGFLRVMMWGFSVAEDWLRRSWAFSPREATFVRRSHLASVDLLALGHDTQPDGWPQPAPSRLDIPADRASVLGVLYTLEGSRLGARVLRARVPPGLSCAFLGDEAAMMDWCRLRMALRDLDDPGIDRAVAASLAVFGAFQKCAEGTGDGPAQTAAASVSAACVGDRDGE